MTDFCCPATNYIEILSSWRKSIGSLLIIRTALTDSRFAYTLSSLHATLHDCMVMAANPENDDELVVSVLWFPGSEKGSLVIIPVYTASTSMPVTV